MSKYIELTGMRSGKLIIDDEFSYLLTYKWKVNRDGYAQAYCKGKNKKIHRLIMGEPIGKDVDHINHNKLDNRISNLRICSRSENHHNSKIQKNNATGYKGVHYKTNAKKFVAQIKLNNKRIHIGYFRTAIEASVAYNETAKKLFGEYAYVN